VLGSVTSGFRNPVLRDVVSASGFSNLVMSHNLAVLLSRQSVYFTRDSQRDLLFGWLVMLLALTALTYSLLRLYRRHPKVRKALTLVAIPAGAFAIYAFGRSIGLTWSLAAGPVAIGTVLAPSRAWRLQKMNRLPVVMAGLYELSAFYAVLCLGSAFWSIAHPYYTPNYDSNPPRDTHAPIVWVIFDELDQGWLFDHRPPGLNLPEFDALKQHSVSFSEAERPGPETLVSLPTLLSGRTVVDSKPSSESRLMIQYSGETPVPWGSSGSVFEGMSRLGRSSSLIGFYHNYGAIFAPGVSHIRSEPLVAYGLPAAIEYQFLMFLPGDTRTALEERLGDASLWNKAFVAQGKIRLANQLADTRKAIEDWHSGFIFLHICLPHAPWIDGHLDSSHRGYLGNLELTDQFLKQIRLALQEQGEWDSATLLVSADHNFRQSLMNTPLNHKVPLMIKLPFQKEALASATPVRAEDERWLVEAVANGAVKAPQSAIDFMVHRSKA
jgi:hypothetical protein